MIPFIKHFFQMFCHDELAFTRWIRGAMQTLGVSGAVYADQIAGAIGSPKIAHYVRWAAIICAFAGGAITAGQKNPKPGGEA